jgi:hypothetical protein
MKLDVNTDSAIQLTAKLERLHRSSFPSAVRNTLNDAAFDMKKKEIASSFRLNFKPKTGTIPYVKKLILVEKANGFNVNKMSSLVGFLNPSNSSDKRFVEGLYKQENGGIIDDGLRYLKRARGGKHNGRVQRENFYDKTRVVSGRSQRKGTRKSKFLARAYRAMKEGKPMFMNTMKGNFLVKVNTVSSDILSRKISFDFSFIAMSRKVKKTNLKPTHFVEEAGQKTSKKLENFYQKNAEFQFKKHLK